MRLIHTGDEIIFSMPKKYFDKFRMFLESLELDGENSEILQFWFSEGAWNIETENNEKMLVFFGRKFIHLVIKKDGSFEKIRDKFLYIMRF